MILIIGYIIGVGIYGTLMLLYLKKVYRTELKELTNDEWLEKYKYNKEKNKF